jgi:alpha-glucosidase
MKNIYIKRTYHLLGLLLFIATVACNNNKTVFNSPNNNISITFDLKEGKPTFNLAYNNELIVDNSLLGLTLNNANFSSGLVLNRITESTFNNTWKPVLGKVSKISNNYNEYKIELKEKSGAQQTMNIIYRIYNNGVAFRYIFPQQSELSDFTILHDNTEFNFTKDITWWAANDEHENLGPLPLDSIHNRTKIPLVAKYNNSIWLAIQEAAIFNYSNFVLGKGSRSLSVKCNMEASQGKTGVPTSWRVVMLGNSPGALLESNILSNLNLPNKIDDSSWIIPGKAMWDWRVWGYTAPDGFKYGLNTKSHKRFVNFAAKNNIKYLLIDADWYGPEFDQNSDPTKAKDGIDIQNFLKYADKKGIKVILYLNDVGAKKYGLETILSQFHDWGAAGIKYGFMEGSGQEKVLHTREVTRLCAKYQLLVNFHDLPIPPSGDTRTWPNLIAREYCHAQADAKRSYWPETAVSAAFINMLTGPLDMTNGWYDLNNAQVRERVFQPIPGTVAAETAKLVVYASGMLILPDAPEEYEKKADLFEFIKSLPDNFDEFKVLGGTPDTYISIARRKGGNWYVGNLTTRTGRTLNLPLDFLNKSKKYNATIYEDAPDSHFLNNKEAYRIRQIEVTATSQLKLTLAQGGGCCIRFVAK